MTHSHCPVDAQVQRDEDEVIEEKIDGFGPAPHCSVSPRLHTGPILQLGVEEGAERVDFQRGWFSRAPLHDQGKVEVNDLCERKQRRHNIIHVEIYIGHA